MLDARVLVYAAAAWAVGFLQGRLSRPAVACSSHRPAANPAAPTGSELTPSIGALEASGSSAPFGRSQQAGRSAPCAAVRCKPAKCKPVKCKPVPCETPSAEPAANPQASSAGQPERISVPTAAPPENCASAYVRSPKASVVIQYFKHGTDGIGPQIEGIRNSCPPGTEILVNDDSRSENRAWLRALDGANDFLVHAPNVHEIRGYNRLVQMAAGEVVAFLQDDNSITSGSPWMSRALALFDAHPQLGALGCYQSKILGGKDNDRMERLKFGHFNGDDPKNPHGPRKPMHNKIPFYDNKTDQRFAFVNFLNLGPMLVRKRAFLDVGMFQEAYSCAGEPGIMFESDLVQRMWAKGYQVGFYDCPGVENGVGGQGTLSSPTKSLLRQKNELINNKLYERLWIESGVADASAKAAMDLNERILEKAPSRVWWLERHAHFNWTAYYLWCAESPQIDSPACKVAQK